MDYRNRFALGLLTFIMGISAFAVSSREEDLVYKTTVEGKELHFLVNYPVDWEATDNRPAVVLFHGGGWSSGSYTGFVKHTDYIVSRGLVVFRIQYRLLKKKEPQIPNICTQDARSAMRYVRAHASRFGVDPAKLISMGGSAGGQLAAAVAIENGLDDDQDDLSVSPKPQAMVLFNPVLDLIGEVEKRGASLTQKQRQVYGSISPNDHLSHSTPPSVIFFGEEDKLLPHGTNFSKLASQFNVRSDLHLYPGVGHTFWRRAGFDDELIYVLDEFLGSLGYLEGPPTIRRPTSEEMGKATAQERARTSTGSTE